MKLLLPFAVIILLFTMGFDPQPTPDPNSPPPAMMKGDIFVALNAGGVQWRRADGKLVRTLSTGLQTGNRGLWFDRKSDSLFVTDFDANTVSKFDSSGNYKGNFGSHYDCHPESIVFDGSGNVYVGQAGCSGKILVFDAAGNLLHEFTVETERQGKGSDWLDLAPNQCIMFYTSEGKSVKR